MRAIDHDNPTSTVRMGGPEPLLDGKRPRIALYSHDTQGLGHIRRNLLISRALCREGATPVILLVSGLREATAFSMPQGVDCLTLPSLGKGIDGRYFPRSLDVPMDDLINVRSKTISAVLRSFKPDALIVDKVPRGIFDELVPSLAWLRANAPTKIILGLREILDAPEIVAREWQVGDYESAIRAYYDRIWIYGDRRVYDAPKEYSFPADIAAMTRYAGYLNPLDVYGDDSSTATEPDADETVGDRVLCVVGGGRDGLPLAESFLRSRFDGPGVLITGPLMPEDSRANLRHLADARPNVEIREFVTDPCPLLEEADRVIAMGGYNTVCEVLAYDKPALIIPRTEPRREQLIRAARCAKLSLLDMLHPDRLTPEAISDWLARPITSRAAARDVIDFDGVSRLPQLLEEAIRAERPPMAVAPAI